MVQINEAKWYYALLTLLFGLLVGITLYSRYQVKVKKLRDENVVDAYFYLQK